MAKEYIEREAALESLCTGCEYVPIEEKEVCPYRFTGCQEYANIFAIPAADVVEVRHGHYICKVSEYGRIKMVCSACGEETGMSYRAKMEHLRYCPNCGARMDGDER